MAERLAYRGLFRAGEPVRAADVAAGPPRRAVAPPERAASLALDAALEMARPRCKGAEPLWSLIQRLEFIFCLAPLWDLSEQIEADIAARTGRASRPGRKRHWPIMCALALEVALWDSGSMRAAVRELSDPATWRRLRRATQRAWPDRPDRLLPPRPISRSQYHRARRRHTLPRLAEIKAWAENASAQAARWIGMLDPAAARGVTRPQPGNVVAGDATSLKPHNSLDLDLGDGLWLDPDSGLWLDPATGLLFDPATGLLFDPDTGEIAPHRPGPDGGASAGRRCLILSSRLPHPGERIIHTISLIGPGSDATAYTDDILRLRRQHPAHAHGIAAAVYDGALHAHDMVRLLGEGITPIAKVHRPKGKYATASLGERKITLPGGIRRRAVVTAIDGTPTIAAADTAGETWHIPLTRTRTCIRRNKRRPFAVTTCWRIPPHPLAGPLAGGTLTIPHNPAKPRKAIDTNRALRVIPPSDPDYDRLYGLREDVESTNNHLKERLRYGRSHTIGAHRQQLNLIGYQIHTLITALTSHHQRTAKPLTEWFGQHQPSTGWPGQHQPP